MLLNVSANSKEGAFDAWRQTLKFIGFSCESIRAKKHTLDKFFYNLLRIANHEDMLPDNLKSFYDEMSNHSTDIRDILNNTLAVFIEIYAPYLEGFTESECEEIKNSITTDMFTLSSTASNSTVKSAAEEFKKNQVKTQLYKLWSDKTSGSKNPRDWSEKYRTPILSCVNPSIYTEAKKAFTTFNSSVQSESDINDAIWFLNSSDFFEKIASDSYRDECFAKHFLGYYHNVLNDIEFIRNSLESTGISAYDWNDNPAIKGKIRDLANAEYNAGGSDKIIAGLDSMDAEALKEWLKKAIKKDIGLGIRIIINKEEE